MKRITLILAIIFTWIFITPSCDIVEEPYLVPAGSSGPGPGESVRKVLLEEFTGHKCPNCPDAADLAHDLKTIYKEQLVILSIHAGDFAKPDATGDFTNDFRTVEGTEIHDYFGVAGFGYPTGLVNRAEYKGKKVHFISDWEGALAAVIDLPAQAEIKLTSSYISGTRTLTCKAETKFQEDLAGNFYLCVFIIESGIVSPQKNDQGIIPDYVHNHMLRASMNGAWGEPVGVDGLAVAGEVQENEYSYVLPSEWVAENCGIVAFVYNEATKEVVQAEELDLD